jgi:transposase InsO family protein
MDLHQNARLTLYSREALAQKVIAEEVTLNAAAAAFNVSAKTARKWVRRYQAEQRAGLYDRSSRPHHSPRRTSPEVVEQVLNLRRQRWTGVRIAQSTALSRPTVSRILRHHKLNRMRHLEPLVPVRRYEHPHPGDLLHLDTKKLARIAKPGHRLTGDPRDETRGAGWEMLHVAIDDHSRIAFSQFQPDERAASTVAFLRAAVAYYARLGIRIRRVLTDNAPCYYSDLFAATCQELGIRHLRTRPYTPRTNGKAERFIQTALREWAYARIYQHSAERQAELEPWLHDYNWHRPHASLGQLPPISRSGLEGNNLLRHHI